MVRLALFFFLLDLFEPALACSAISLTSSICVAVSHRPTRSSTGTASSRASRKIDFHPNIKIKVKYFVRVHASRVALHDDMDNTRTM